MVLQTMSPRNINSHNFFHTLLWYNFSSCSKGKVKTLFHLHLHIMICCLIFQFQKMRNKINMILILILYLKMIQVQTQLLFQIRSLNEMKISLKQVGMLMGIQMIEQERRLGIRMNMLHSLTQLHYLQSGATNVQRDAT